MRTTKLTWETSTEQNGGQNRNLQSRSMNMGCLRHTSIIYYLCLLWITVRSSNYPLSVKPELIHVKEGEDIEAKCIVRELGKLPPHYNFGWNLKDKKNGTAVEETTNGNVRVLKIQNAKRQDAGSYRCQLSTDGRNIEKTLHISVSGDSSSQTVPCHDFYQCRGNQQIQCSFRCDGSANCPFADDEDGCPKTKEIFPKEKDNSEDHTAWLKTTVYTVIACTVGVVLFISIVVIAVCRIKMKRAAVRRAMHQAERRRRHGGHSGLDHHGNSSRAQRNNAVEHEPFISAPSSTHFGNIIVNVNNGVQYVPNIDFHSIIQSPPSYQEVIAETQRESVIGRHSPPPIYSTIDRNPNRLSCDLREPADLQLTENTSLLPDTHSNGPSSNEQRNTGIPAPTENQPIIDNRSNGDNGSHLGHSSNVPITSSVNNFQTSCSVIVSGRDGTRSLERLCRNRQGGSRSRPNVRAVAAPRRPKQLQVRDGQIILNENSSPSSSPETVNRNTQTNLADISQSNLANASPASQNSSNLPSVTPPTGSNSTSPTQNKPAQLRVQAGQIVLDGQSANQSIMTTSLTNDPGGASSDQGRLEVKEGNIVFKTP